MSDFLFYAAMGMSGFLIGYGIGAVNHHESLLGFQCFMAAMGMLVAAFLQFRAIIGSSAEAE